MRARVAIPVFGLLMGGCSPVDGAAPLGFFLASAGIMAFGTLLWAAGFAVAGGLLGGIWCYLLSVRTARRRGRALTGGGAMVAWILTPLVLAAGLGVVGLQEGIYRGGAHALTQSDAARKIYSSLGGLGADLVAFVYLQTAPRDQWPHGTDTVPAGVDAFRQGGWELDLDALARRWRREIHRVGQSALAFVRSEADRYPALRDGMGEHLLHQLLSTFSTALADEGKSSADGDRTMAQDLRRRANQEGLRGPLTHGELARLVVADVVAEPVLGPILKMIRGSTRWVQILGLIVTLPVLLIPVIAFRLDRQARRVHRPRLDDLESF